MNLQKTALSIDAVVSLSKLQTADIDDNDTVAMLLSMCLLSGEILKSFTGKENALDDRKLRCGTNLYLFSIFLNLPAKGRSTHLPLLH